MEYAEPRQCFEKCRHVHIVWIDGWRCMRCNLTDAQQMKLCPLVMLDKIQERISKMEE